jgi:aquaporin Z
MSKSTKRYLAECIGTAVLVLIGCGAVAIGGLSGNPVINVAAIGLAFGLAVMAVAYSLGPISGAHINPAVTVAMLTAGRMKSDEAVGYIIAQLIGAVIGAALLWAILSGKAGGYNIATAGLAQNGYGQGVLGQYGLPAAALAELVATLIFTVVILAVTAGRAANPLAGLVIGLTLFALHLPFFNVTGLSVNPARSLGPAVLVGGNALMQLWLFLVVPTVAGAIAGWLFRQKILTA